MLLQSMRPRIGIRQPSLFIVNIDSHEIRAYTAERLQGLIGFSSALCQILFDQAHDLLHVPDIVGDRIGCLCHRLFTAGLRCLFHAGYIQ